MPEPKSRREFGELASRALASEKTKREEAARDAESAREQRRLLGVKAELIGAFQSDQMRSVHELLQAWIVDRVWRLTERSCGPEESTAIRAQVELIRELLGAADAERWDALEHAAKSLIRYRAIQ